MRKTLAETKHLHFVEFNGWSFVVRPSGRDIVAVLPIIRSPDGHHQVVLIEQHRPPVDANVIELPAGVVGDKGPEATEPAARRELVEESGYEAGKMTLIGQFTASAGLTDELISIYLAEDLKRIGSGGGLAEENEKIIVHHVSLHDLRPWLHEQKARGTLISGLVYASLGLSCVALGISPIRDL